MLCFSFRHQPRVHRFFTGVLPLLISGELVLRLAQSLWKDDVERMVEEHCISSLLTFD